MPRNPLVTHYENIIKHEFEKDKQRLPSIVRRLLFVLTMAVKYINNEANAHPYSEHSILIVVVAFPNRSTTLL